MKISLPQVYTSTASYLSVSIIRCDVGQLVSQERPWFRDVGFSIDVLPPSTFEDDCVVDTGIVLKERYVFYDMYFFEPILNPGTTAVIGNTWNCWWEIISSMAEKIIADCYSFSVTVDQAHRVANRIAHRDIKGNGERIVELYGGRLSLDGKETFNQEGQPIPGEDLASYESEKPLLRLTAADVYRIARVNGFAIDSPLFWRTGRQYYHIRGPQRDLPIIAE